MLSGAGERGQGVRVRGVEGGQGERTPPGTCVQHTRARLVSKKWFAISNLCKKWCSAGLRALGRQNGAPSLTGRSKWVMTRVF